MPDEYKTYRINFVRYGWMDFSEKSLEDARKTAEEHAKKNPENMQQDTMWQQIEEFEIIEDEEE